MKIHGNLVYLDMPQLTNIEGLTLLPEAKKEMIESNAKKFDRLKVFAVADSVSHIKVGDEVFVKPQALQASTKITIDNSEKLVVSAFDIFHTW